jgi:hypothetical protein
LWKNKNTNMAGSWNLKCTFYFMKTAHEPLYLDKWSFVQWKIMDIPTSFTWIVIFFDRAFEYGGGLNFEVMLGQTLYHFLHNFCNFVKCHTFANCLPCNY